MFVENKKIAICYHLHFVDLIPELIWILSRFDKDVKKIVSVTPDINLEHVDVIKRNIKGVDVIKVENFGRDLYPLVSLIKDGGLDKYDWVLKIHGKKSKHRADGDRMRRDWTEFLAPEHDPYQILRELPEHLSDVRLIAPKQSLINPATKRNWVSNSRWVEEILSRYEMFSDEEFDVRNWFYPILAGSFYWLSRSGMQHIKSLPLDDEDWTISARSGPGIDGLLEHAVERLMLFHLVGNKAPKTESFVLTEQINNISSFEVYDTIDLTQNSLEQIIPSETIPKQSHILQNNKKHSFLAHWIVKSKNNRTNFYCLFYSEIERSALHQLLEIRICGKKYKQFRVSDIAKELYLPGVCSGQFMVEFELYGEFSSTDVEVGVNGYIEPLKNISKKSFISAIKKASYVTHDTVSIMTPEQMNMGKFPITKVIRESRRASKIYNKAPSEFWSFRATLQKPKLHIFVVNNSFTAITAARVIEQLTIPAKQILIVYHRIKSSPLLCKFETIQTTFVDYEIDINANKIKEIIGFYKTKINKYLDEEFALYSYHYMSLFVSLLSWSPNCIQCNLLEEGNLNSRPLHDFNRVKESDIMKFLPEKLKLQDIKALNAYIFQMVKAQKSNLFTGLSLHFPRYLVGGMPSLDDVISINSLQRDYFSHPKMAVGSVYFRISPSLNWLPVDKEYPIIQLKKKSRQEVSLLNKYRSFGEQYTDVKNVVFAGAVGSIDEYLDRLFNNYKSKLRDLKKINLIYLKHPASNRGAEEVDAIRRVFKAKLKSVFVDLVEAPADIASDLFCCAADLTIHYDSSLARSVSMISPESELLNCNIQK